MNENYSQHPDFWSDADDVQAPVEKRNTLVLPERKTVAYPIGEPAKIVEVQRIFEAQAGADEKTSGVDRANGLVVRMLVPGCASLCLGFAVALVLAFNGGGEWSAPAALAILAMGLAYVYNRMDEREYQHSRAGLERHRIDTAAALKAQELAQQHELRRQALGAYMRHLEVDSDDR